MRTSWRDYIQDRNYTGWRAPDLRRVRAPRDDRTLNEVQAAELLGIAHIDLVQSGARLRIPRIDRNRYSAFALSGWLHVNGQFPFSTARALDESGSVGEGVNAE